MCFLVRAIPVLPSWKEILFIFQLNLLHKWARYETDKVMKLKLDIFFKWEWDLRIYTNMSAYSLGWPVAYT